MLNLIKSFFNSNASLLVTFHGGNQKITSVSYELYFNVDVFAHYIYKNYHDVKSIKLLGFY